MKKFIGAIIAAAMLVLCFTLSACGDRYHSKYSSGVMTTTSSPTQASVLFDSFSGIYVIKLTNTNDSEVSITYNAKLGEGNIKVYYDFNEEKLDLFEIAADGSVEGKTQTFTGNKIIYVIIESDGKCKEGSFTFALVK